MLTFDQSTIWQALEERLARTQHPRHRQLLSVVIAHGKAEAARDLDGLMATLVADPQYHFRTAGRDHGPKGYDAVRAYYLDFVLGGGAVFESPKERIIVDDDMVGHEGTLSTLVSGAIARRRGYDVPAETGHYLVRHRGVVLWSFDDAGLALGEDSYSQIHPDDWVHVPDEDLPLVYVDYLAEIGASVPPH